MQAFGLHLHLSAPAGYLASMLERLPPGWVAAPPGTPVDRRYELIDATSRPTLLIDGGPAAHDDGLDGVLDAVDADAQAFVAEMAPGHVFLHAGVVGVDGDALLVPGSSWSGKTTLVVELVRAGATYYSDEYAVLDAAGRVHPYPRRLAIREPGRRRRLSAESLGGVTGKRPLQVRLVLLCRYRAGGHWTPECLTPGRAVLALVEHTVSIRRQPDVALAALRQVVSGARIFAGERGDAATLARQLIGGRA